MIVISIIAILSAVGMTIYLNAPKSARDARRIADIDAIANAIELHKTSTGYLNPTTHSDWFADGKIPYDPKTDGLGTIASGCGDSTSTDTYKKSCWYCEYSPARSDGLCSAIDQFFATTNQSGPYIQDNARSWTVCANLEAGNAGYYCKRSQQ